MRDPRDLFTLTSSQPVVDRPLLIHALGLAMDAGRVGAELDRTLLESGNPVLMAQFDTDELRVYSNRRGRIEFDGERYTEYEPEGLQLYLLQDSCGAHFLYLSGREPDLRWEACSDAIMQLLEIYGVRGVMSLASLPGAVPHTKPIVMIAHATNPQRVIDYPNVTGTISAPASFASMLEYRLGQAGFEAWGLVAQVPHYLAAGHYPQATLALLAHVKDMTGLSIDQHELAQRAFKVDELVAAQIEHNSEISSMVQELEAHYDESAAGGKVDMSMEGALPSADELAEQFEAFLDQVNRDDEGSS